jgi:hypothetical protein
VHLHFEIRTPGASGDSAYNGGGNSSVVDPLLYITPRPKVVDKIDQPISGLGDLNAVIKAGGVSYDGGAGTAPDGTPAPGSAGYNKQMGEAESRGGCNNYHPSGSGPDNTDTTAPGSPSGTVGKNGKCPCAKNINVSKSSVEAQVKQLLNSYGGGLSQTDVNFTLRLIQIESRWDPFAYNSGTKATGLYQFLYHWHNHGMSFPQFCDFMTTIDSATKYYIEKWYRPSILAPYNAWKAGKWPSNPLRDKALNGSSASAVLYAFHHDGSGAVRSGKNMAGLPIWKQMYGNA